MDQNTYEKITSLRKALHEIPELSGCEQKTMALLKKFITENTALRLVDRGGWFYALHEEDGAEMSIAFRADMDAVPGEDGTAFHGCGHDGHSAVLAGLCLLTEGKVLGKNVYFIFQPAEETGRGGRECSGLLSEKKIKEIYGFHNLPGYPLGTAVLRKGTFACASRGLILSFKGRQSHAAYPEQGINPAWLIGELICRLPGLSQDPEFKGMVLATIVEVKAGDESFGVSPGDGKLALTVRAERLGDLERFQASIVAFAEKKSSEQGMEFQYFLQDQFPDTVNDKNTVELCRKKLENSGITCVEAEEPLRWSEDFGWYLKKAGGMFFGVGSGENCPGLHTPSYEFPDEAVKTALAAFEVLSENNGTPS